MHTCRYVLNDEIISDKVLESTRSVSGVHEMPALNLVDWPDSKKRKCAPLKGHTHPSNFQSEDSLNLLLALL